MSGFNADNIKLYDRVYQSPLRINNHDGFTWLRATSRSSPLPPEPDFATSRLKSVDHVVHCSTTLNAEEYTQASTKSGGRLA